MNVVHIAKQPCESIYVYYSARSFRGCVFGGGWCNGLEQRFALVVVADLNRRLASRIGGVVPRADLAQSSGIQYEDISDDQKFSEQCV